MATENRIGVWNWGKMYIPAKYLQSTGTQWIDIEFNETDDEAFDYAWMWSNPSTYLLGGSQHNSMLYNGNYGAGIEYAWKTIALNTSANVKHTMEQKVVGTTMTMTVDGNKTFTAAIGKAAGDKVVLFGCNGGSRLCAAKIYYFRVTTGGKVVRDLVPCLDLKGKPAMFDNISKKFFYNKGTGEFGFELKARIPLNEEFRRPLESYELKEAA